LAAKTPTHWELLEGKRIFANRRESSGSDDEQLAASQHYGVVPQSLMMRMRMNDVEVMLALKGTSTFRHVETDDFVISLRSFEGGIEHSAYIGCVSPAYTVLSAQKPISSGYYKFLLKSGPFIAALQSTTDSLRDGKAISYSNFGSLKLPLPPKDEQKQIAAFLDYETAKIDALIEKQQQLIALLGEKRQAVISHAVSKGLNPDAPMRDSGVEWLGEVPEHWNVTRLKFLVSQVADCHHSTPHYDDDAQWPALRTSDVFAGVLDVENARRIHTSEYLERISRLKPETGDVIYAREGGRWGIAAPVPEGADVCLAQRVMLLRGNDRMMSQFVMWSLNSRPIYHQLDVNVVGSASPHVNIGDVLEVWVAEPPITEQPIIISRLEHQLSKLDSLDEQCVKVIDTLQERRTALISAAVTGKIDVRGWQPPSADSQLESEMEVA